jgi:predicted nucleic acid-binding protein
MTAAVFVDTNVLLYWRDARQPSKQRLAASWLERLWREGIARASMQVLSEYYVNATRKLRPGLSPDAAWEDVKMFLAWNPLPVDRALLEAAHDVERHYRLHWWDCQIVAAARLQGCSILLSEDLQDGANYGGVTVRSPFTLAVSEAESLYQPGPVLASRHRPRGRPRKVAAT